MSNNFFTDYPLLDGMLDLDRDNSLVPEEAELMGGMGAMPSDEMELVVRTPGMAYTVSQRQPVAESGQRH